jgi:CRP-like cAMP-binding protein
MKEINRLETGDYFGERALLTEEARTATVVALEKCECLALR